MEWPWASNNGPVEAVSRFFPRSQSPDSYTCLRACRLLVAALVFIGGCKGTAPESGPNAGGVPGVNEPIVPLQNPGTVPVAPKIAPVARVQSVDDWVDLIAQRPSAGHIREERLLIDLGSLAARKYLEVRASSPWVLAQDVDGRKAGVLIGKNGSFDIPLDGGLAPSLHDSPEDPNSGLGLAITVHALAPKQFMTVLVDERPLANLQLKGGWERRTFTLPTDRIRSGENRIRVFFRRTAERTDQSGKADASAPVREVSAAIQMIEVGPLSAIRQGAPQMIGYEVEPKGNDGEQLIISGGSSLVYYLEPPRRSRLHIEMSGDAEVSVLASTDLDHREGRAPTKLLSARLVGLKTKQTVDITGFTGVPTRFEVRVAGNGKAKLASLGITAERTVPVDRRKRELRDIYVFAVEGLRGDSFDAASLHRYPTIESFFRESLVFDRAYSVGAAAVPSHAGWLSSTVPSVHLTVRGTFLSGSQTLLSEVLQQADYRTEAYTTNRYLNQERGLAQGFDALQLLAGSTGRPSHAVEACERMVLPMEGDTRAHFRLFNVNDPQAPYDPPQSIVEVSPAPEGAPLRHLTHMWVGRVRAGRHEPTKTELKYVKGLYQGELKVLNDALERLISRLREARRLDDSIIVFMGIHGEEFYDHQSAGHGRTLYEESIRVPLVVRAPGLLASGVVESPVDLLDLAPTLLDLVGLETPAQWQGRSMLPMVDDPQPAPRLSVSYLGDGSRAAILGRHKLILGPGRGLDAQQYFDLGMDPKESDNRVRSGGIGLRMVRTALVWERAEEKIWLRRRWGSGANLNRAFALDHGL